MLDRNKSMEDSQVRMDGVYTTDGGTVSVYIGHDKPYQCNLCGQRFSNRRYLVSIHMKTHTGEEPFKCSICGKTLSSNQRLVGHMRTHTGETLEKPHQCKYCQKSFTKRDVLTNHMRLHVGAKHICTVCGKSYSWQSGLRSHMKTHKENEGYSCNLCTKKFVNQQQLDCHLRIHAAAKQSFRCSFCEQGFSLKCDLESHVRSVHPSNGNSYVCKWCSKNFSNEIDLDVHTRTCTRKYSAESSNSFEDDEVVLISELGPSCINNGTSDNDVSVVSSITRENIVGETNVKNDSSVTHAVNNLDIECTTVNSSNGAVTIQNNQHSAVSVTDTQFIHQPLPNVELDLNTQSLGMVYQCDPCGKNFKQKSELIEHLQIHKREKPYECKYCGLRFTNRRYFESIHMKTHTGTNPFRCNVCGKTLSSNQRLVGHMRTHTRKTSYQIMKPYQCSHCQRTFAKRDHLKNHMRLHLGEKYKCPICGKKFSWRSGLRSHVKIHTGNEAYSCSLCAERFENKQKLDSHFLRVHAGEKPFSCNICGLGFLQKDNLDTHMRSCHSVQRELYPCKWCSESFTNLNDLNVHTHKCSNRYATDYANQLQGESMVQSIEIAPSRSFTNDTFTKMSMVEDPNQQTSGAESIEVAPATSFMNDTLTQICIIDKKQESSGAESIEVGASHINKEISSEIPCMNLPRDDEWDNYYNNASFNPEVNMGPPNIACPEKPPTLPSNHQSVAVFFPNSQFSNQTIQNGEINLNHRSTNEIYQCLVCNKSFKGKSEMKDHLQAHERDKPYQCGICGQRFTNRRYFQSIHMKTHTGNEPFKCSICGKTLSSNQRLVGHMRTHTGEALKKPHQCKYCQKNFTTRDILINHMRLHVGKKLHCKVCGKTFSWQSGLRSHMNLHSGTEAYSCSLCAKKFVNKQKLDCHFRIHTRQKQFHCSFCEISFMQKFNLDSHIKSVHFSDGNSYTCNWCSGNFSNETDLDIHTQKCTSKSSTNIIPQEEEDCVVIPTYTDEGILNVEISPEKRVDNIYCDNTSSTHEVKQIDLDQPVPEVTVPEEPSEIRTDYCSSFSVTNIEYTKEALQIVELDLNQQCTQLGYHCEPCGQTFDLKSELTDHMESHRSEKPYHCSHCGLQFTNRRYFKNVLALDFSGKQGALIN
uniref:Zinc finger protein Xfin-like n=1 Tax=Saccoglossus kowalevskii TaxID=10224 RepID=A0ABM0MM14_SACKO|nr:PREDICTED: zinc finger protein Xfin-like [Saccoglossus kowalevskii]